MRRPLLLILALAACNPYDPQLGDRPFLCGSDEPRCPDGYVAVDLELDRCECRRGGTVADGGVYQCTTDPNEPNETISSATETTVGTNMQYMAPNAAICRVAGSDDVDVYHLMAPRAGTLITVDVAFFDDTRVPTIDLLDSGGVSVARGMPSPEPRDIVATFTAPTPASYFAKVSAAQDVNYSIRITIIEPP